MKLVLLSLVIALLAAACCDSHKVAARKKDKGEWIESRADNYTEVNAVSL